MTTTPESVIYRRGRVEADRLTRALLDAAAAGKRPHCSDAGLHNLWLSEQEAERQQAARLCHGCVVYQPCGEAADARDERWHVWGGRDYTRKPRTKQAA